MNVEVALRVVPGRVIVNDVDRIIANRHASFYVFEVDLVTKYPVLDGYFSSSSSVGVRLFDNDHTLYVDLGRRYATELVVDVPNVDFRWDVVATASRYTARVVVYRRPEKVIT